MVRIDFLQKQTIGRQHIRTLPQQGKPAKDIRRDYSRKAILPGKRISERGNVYWETRPNRTDRNKSRL